MDKRMRMPAFFLVVLLALGACSTGGGGTSSVPPSGANTGANTGTGGSPPGQPTGPVLFLSDLPGICNGNGPGTEWTCTRPCFDTPPPAGFSVGNDGDQPLSWSASITAPLRLTPASGVVAPFSRVGQRVSITPPTNAVYQITVQAVGLVATIQVNCS